MMRREEFVRRMEFNKGIKRLWLRSEAILTAGKFWIGVEYYSEDRDERADSFRKIKALIKQSKLLNEDDRIGFNYTNVSEMIEGTNKKDIKEYFRNLSNISEMVMGK